jgi:DNA invertase Pin-like site-specific DNA recombinase
MPPTSKRVAAYLRVSSEEQLAGFSLDAQARAIAEYCRERDSQIIACYRDEGKSARTDDLAKRPEFRRMLADAENGMFDIVIVHKLDRFARNRRVAFEAFERLSKAGVGFVSLQEHLDYSTAAGQLMLTMLVGLAAFYSDNLAGETAKGKRERKAQGLYNGLLPFGVTKGAEGLPVLDRVPRLHVGETSYAVVPAEGLQLAFELAASGKPDREIAKALNAAGYRTSGNRGANLFSKDTVRRILTNRFYLGELPDGEGGRVPGRHGALIDPALFAQAQRARDANTQRPLRVAQGASPWALSGVATCSCGASMRAYGRSGGKRRVQCVGRTERGECDEPTFFAHIVEDQIGELLQQFVIPASDRDRLYTAWRRSQRHAVDIVAERVRLTRKLDRLKRLYVEGDMDDAEYRAQKTTTAAALAALPEDQGNPDEAVGRRLMAFLGDLASAWQVATAAERNKIARQLFVEVIVENRTAVAVVPRPDVRPFFETLRCQGPNEMTRWRKRRDSNPRSQP